MAETKKPNNTSKTAHVMNLLSRNRAPSPPEASAAAASPEPKQAPLPEKPASTAPIITSMTSDSTISSQVKNALEDALSNELSFELSQQQEPASDNAYEQSEPVSDPVYTPEPAASNSQDIDVSAPEAEDDEFIPMTIADLIKQEPEPEPEIALQSDPEPVANPDPASQSAPSLDEAAMPSPAIVQQAPSVAVDVFSGISYVNVMQTLVEEKVDKYISMFGLCSCPRCVTDVKALALNNLQPKYVVMREGEAVPRITLYENQFSAAVTAQILRACTQVMENPRH